MLDVAPTELLMVAVVALVVIGPKDLPRAMRMVGHWVGRARGVARQFRSGFDAMVREAELAEMEQKWAAENERIMREHPQPAEARSMLPPPPRPPEPPADTVAVGDAGPDPVRSSSADGPVETAPQPLIRDAEPLDVAARRNEGDIP